VAKWDDLLKRGLKGERLVREWLKLRGFYVLPASLIENGGAPALEGHLKRIIASNHLVAGSGETFWAEVKTYQRATFNQKRQRWEHGIPIRLWEQYKEGQRITGIPGYLFILQLNDNLILEGKLDDIEIGSVKTQGIHHPPSGPQIFFDVRRFKRYPSDTLEEMKPEDIPPKTIRPWEVRKFPKEQQLPLL
jgi:hypothetical protein